MMLFFRFLARRTLAIAVLLSLTLSAPARAIDSVRGGPLTEPAPLFPADNWWNLDVSRWPVDANSSGYIAFINNGGTRRLHPDLGGDASSAGDPYATYGMPYAVVTGVTSA